MTDQHAAFFKCFSTTSRNQMAHLLSQQVELSVEELARRVGLKVSTVSRHLQLMRLQNIVSSRSAHPMRYYSLNKGVVSAKCAKFLQYVGGGDDGPRLPLNRRTAARLHDPPTRACRGALPCMTTLVPGMGAMGTPPTVRYALRAQLASCG